jgi:hypothetical protein
MTPLRLTPTGRGGNSIRVRASRKERQGNRALRDLDVSDRGSLGFKGDCRYWEDLLRIGD